MKLGFGLPMSGGAVTPDTLVMAARRAEALGYHSLWTFQRLLFPVAPRNAYYGAPGTAWPEAFRSVLDPIVTLSFVAAATERIRLGVSVLLTPFYEPVVLGKMLASLDVLSRGRLDVGLGTGWSLDELAAVGAPMEERSARADEFVRCLKAVWADEEVDFQGRFHAVPRARIEPKPVQRPHPPLLLGGYTDRVFRRIARYADGYTGGNIPAAALVALLDRLRRIATEEGRDPSTLRIVCRGSFRLTPAAQPDDRPPLTGSADQILEDLRRYAAAGVTELFLEPNFQPGSVALSSLLEAMEALGFGGESISPKPLTRK